MIDVYNTLVQSGLEVSVYDPWVDSEAVQKEFGVELVHSKSGQFDYTFKAVNHSIFN